MFCSKCGTQINDEAVICPNCGCKTENFGLAKTDSNYSGTAEPPQIQDGGTNIDGNLSNAKSDAKLLGIIGIISGILIPLAGWICGAIGVSKANQVLRRYPTDSEAISCKNINIGAIVIGSIMFIINMIIIFAIFN